MWLIGSALCRNPSWMYLMFSYAAQTTNFFQLNSVTTALCMHLASTATTMQWSCRIPSTTEMTELHLCTFDSSRQLSISRAVKLGVAKFFCELYVCASLNLHTKFLYPQTVKDAHFSSILWQVYPHMAITQQRYVVRNMHNTCVCTTLKPHAKFLYPPTVKDAHFSSILWQVYPHMAIIQQKDVVRNIHNTPSLVPTPFHELSTSMAVEEKGCESMLLHMPCPIRLSRVGKPIIFFLAV